MQRLNCSQGIMCAAAVLSLVFPTLMPAQNTPLELLKAKFGEPFSLLTTPSSSPRQALLGYVGSSEIDQRVADIIGPATQGSAQVHRSTSVKTPFNTITGNLGVGNDYFAIVGDGLNSMSGVPGGSCIQFSPANSKSELFTADGLSGGHRQDLDYSIHEVDTVEQLLDELNLTASAQYSSGMYSADATVNYFNQYRYSKYTVFVVVKELIINEAVGLIQRSPTELAKEALGKGAQELLNTCGDSYVRGVVRGGFFAAILRFQAVNESQLTTLHGQINATIGPAKGSADLVHKIESIKSYSERDAHILRVGTSDSVSDDYKSITEYAKSFPGKISKSKNAAIIALITADIGTTLSIPKEIPAQVRAFRLLAADQSSVKKLLNGIEFIKSHQELYGPLPADTDSKRTELERTLGVISSTMRECAATLSTKCQTQTSTNLPAFVLPEKIVWSKVDVSIPREQSVGASSIGNFVLIPKGCWYPHKQNKAISDCVGPPDGGWLLYHFAPIKPGDSDLRGALLLPTAIPPSHNVTVKLYDRIDYTDNETDEFNPLKVGIYELTDAAPPKPGQTAQPM